MALDETDRKLLGLLAADSRQQYAELGKKLNLSAPAVHARVKRLERDGVIEQYTIRINPDAVSRPLCAFVRLAVTGEWSCAEISEEFAKLPEIEECHSAAGEDCLIMKVRVKNPLALDDLLTKIRQTRGIQRSTTTILLRTHIDRATDAH